MKYRPDRKQISWGITIFITLAMCIIFGWIVSNASFVGGCIRSVITSLEPILYGIVIAFLLNPVLNFVERKWIAPYYLKKKDVDVFDPSHRREKMRMRRLSVLLSILFLIGVIAAIVCIVVPQLVMSVQTIAANISIYRRNVNNFFEDLAAYNPEMEEEILSVIGMVESALMDWYDNNMSSIIGTLTSVLVSFGKGVWNFIIGTIVSIYLLYSKDTLRGQGKRLAYALFRERTANEIIGGFRYFDLTFIGFLVGKLVDSLIIGIICFVVTTIIRTPFPALISVIVGITNIVPFFGPWIGAIIGGIIIFMISPVDCLWFVILCLALQIFDGYFLGPKILGNSTGLSNFWVIFAIMLFGGLWGFVGWIIGVPLFACFYEFARRIVNHIMCKRGIGGNTSSDHMQQVAYYEAGEERELGDPEAVQYYANRVRTNVWTRALGSEKRKKAKAREQERSQEREQDKSKDRS